MKTPCSLLRPHSLLSVLISIQIALIPGCGLQTDSTESTSGLSWDADTPDSDRPSPSQGDITKEPVRGEMPQEKDPPEESGYCLTNCADPGETDPKTKSEFHNVQDNETGEFAGVVAADPGTGAADGDGKSGTVFTTPEYGGKILDDMGAEPQSVADVLAGNSVVTGEVTCTKSDGVWRLDPDSIAMEPVNAPDPSRAPALAGTGDAATRGPAAPQGNITPDTAGTIGQVANHKQGGEQPAVTSETPATARGDGRGESLYPDTGNKPGADDGTSDDKRPKGMPANGNLPLKEDPTDVALGKIRENVSHQASHLTREFADAGASLNAGRNSVASAERHIRQTHNKAVGGIPRAAGLDAGMAGASPTNLPKPRSEREPRLQTPQTSPHYRDLEAAYDYYGYVANEVARDNSTNREQRQNTVDAAGIGLGMADEAFADGDGDAGKEILQNSLELLDTALDFIPGVSTVKDAVAVMTGTNPVTGQSLSAVELAITTAGLFLPSAVSGSAKVAAKVGKRLAKAGKKNRKAADLARKTDFDQLDQALRSAKEAVDAMGADKFMEVLKTQKGARPTPSSYLPQEYIDNHLTKFNDGASRFMRGDDLRIHGPAHIDGTSYVMPSREADQVISSTGGNKRALEEALGLPPGSFDGSEVVRINVADPRSRNVRIPSGNEAGTNGAWLPGGKLPNGNSEAVLDLRDAPAGSWTSTTVDW